MGSDALVACRGGENAAGEVLRPVIGSVVVDDAGDPVDAVGCEERPCSRPEPDRGGRGFVRQGLGVGQAGQTVHSGVQIHLPGPGSFGFGPVGGFRGFGAAPAAAVGDPPDFFHVEVAMWAGYLAMILVLVRLPAPAGSMSRRREIPSRRSHRATVTGEIR